MSAMVEELKWRGLVAQTTDEQALSTHLDGANRSVYCGFDPTAPSLHFGNLVQLIVLRHLQRAGHRVFCLVGGSTGLIGDPRPAAERVLRSKDDTAANVARIQDLVQPFLSFEGSNAAVMVNNLDWTAEISALDFLRDFGKHFRVNQMIRKDAVSARLASHEGISYTEFSYQILQALDFLHLFQQHGVTVQTGGQDQWGNLTAGVDLVHRVEGTPVYALTTPLLTDSSGEKFGKSAGNAIWLSADMTTPFDFYQYWLNLDDADVLPLVKVFTDRTRQEFAELAQATEEAPQRRVAQRALAMDVTTLVHGGEVASNVAHASSVLFGKADPRTVDAVTLLDAVQTLPRAAGVVGGTVLDALLATGLVDSKGAGRRVVSEGGVSVNNVKVHDPESIIGPEDFVHGAVALLKRGRRNIAALHAAPA